MSVLTLTREESDALIAKAKIAADTHSRGLVMADADTWPYVSAVWQVGWIKGYLARKQEDRTG